jgi:hypothetical protein
MEARNPEGIATTSMFTMMYYGGECYQFGVAGMWVFVKLFWNKEFHILLARILDNTCQNFEAVCLY